MLTDITGVSSLFMRKSLTLKASKYFCINDGDEKVFFKLEIIISVLVRSFCLLFEYLCQLWIYHHHHYVFFQCGERLQTSESDVYRYQIVTTKVDPLAVRGKVWLCSDEERSKI